MLFDFLKRLYFFVFPGRYPHDFGEPITSHLILQGQPHSTRIFRVCSRCGNTDTLAKLGVKCDKRPRNLPWTS